MECEFKSKNPFCLSHNPPFKHSNVNGFTHAILHRSAKGWKISLPPDPREENRETGMQVGARSERRIDSFCEKKRDVNQDALCVCTYSVSTVHHSVPVSPV